MGLDLPVRLPEQGVGGAEALEALAGAALGERPAWAIRLHGPYGSAHAVDGVGGCAVGRGAEPEPLASAPAARELESRVVAWLAEPYGMDGGHLLPESSVAT